MRGLALAIVACAACGGAVAPLPVASPSACDERHQRLGGNARQEAVFYDQVADALSARWEPDRGAVRPRRAVIVELTVAPSGGIRAARVKSSSGEPAFDDEAVAAAARAGRVPAPPGALVDPIAGAATIAIGFGLEAGELHPSQACADERASRDGDDDPLRVSATPSMQHDRAR